jgi:large subunit ribosomal protein L25
MALVERTHETMLIQAPVEELRRAMAHVDGHGRMEFQIEGEDGSRRAIVKHVEQDPMKQELIHVTLQEVADEDMVKIDVPVVAIGHSAEADGSGVALTTVTDHLKIRGRMMDLPERIEVDISNLGVGEHISASEITLPPGVELLSPADATLFTVTLIREPDTTVPNEAEAETGEVGAEGAPSASPGEQGSGGIFPSGQGVPSEDGKA